MKNGVRKLLAAALMAALSLQAGWAQDTSAKPVHGKLYVVGTAHLDTQWRWTIQQTIADYIPATLHKNFALFEAYPDYTFSFEGAFRYMLMKEYYPQEYARLRQYIDQGRWHVAGSWLCAVDTNIPSSESLIRQALYGNGFFRHEFGKESVDIFLPDCFGFGYALPAIAHHTGLTGFSTQKLQWGCWAGTPFDIGRWRGVDGSEVVAAVNPGAYVSRVTTNLASDSTWEAAVAREDSVADLPVAYHYVGVGDTGGAPSPESVAKLEEAIHDTAGPLNVVSTASDQLFRDLTPGQVAKLPVFNDELVMTRHGVGCYTSQAVMKRWNRMNETLARAAEVAAVDASLLGGMDYPRERLRNAWTRFLWHQFHDDITGTSIPEAYTFSWNDEILAQNQFAGVLTSATGEIAGALDTRTEGQPLVVFNPLAFARTDVVQARVAFPEGAPKALVAVGPDGKTAPVQIADAAGDSVTVLLLATVPSTGYAVYDLRPASKPEKVHSGLEVKTNRIENERYRVKLDKHGDIASIYDKQLRRELLAQPLRLELLYDKPDNWPAWELNYRDVMAAPIVYVGGKPEVRIVEHGPVRASLEIVRHLGESTFTETVSLESGDGSDRVDIGLVIDWREPERMLKVALRPDTKSDSVVYDLGLGVKGRPVNTEKRYEVPGQEWADLSGDSWGVAMLTRDKYGWDHPDPGTLRLTLLHTPGISANWVSYDDQKSMDLGIHRTRFAILGHSGSWQQGAVPLEGQRYNNPLRAFTSPKSEGSLGRSTSLLHVNTPPAPGENAPLVLVKAVKLAEESNEIVVRLQEQGGVARDRVAVSFERPVIRAREVDGAEHELGEATVENGSLVTSLKRFQPRTFAVTLAPAEPAIQPPFDQPINLAWNLDGVSFNTNPTDGAFDLNGISLAGELLPDSLVYGGVHFVTGPKDDGAKNMLVPHGEALALPEGNWDHLVLLAASARGNRAVTFTIEGQPMTVNVNAFDGNIGQWTSRVVGGRLEHDPAKMLPAYIEHQPVAWVGTHRHSVQNGDEPYLFTYLYEVVLPLPQGTREVILPDDSELRIAAATAVRGSTLDVTPAQPLYDTASGFYPTIAPLKREFADSMRISLACRESDAALHYTLDGSRPNADSPVYSGPILLTRSTTVRAVAILNGNTSHEIVADFTALSPMPAIDTTGLTLQPGLNYRVYQGCWNKLPEFTALQPIASGTLDKVALPPEAPDTSYGVVLEGYFHAEKKGANILTITSDDGSRLYVDRQLIVDSDGLHGPDKVRAAAYLLPGWHKLRVVMFQKYGGATLEASIITPDGREHPLNGELIAR